MSIINSTLLPTKTNLMKIKNTIKISKQGQELLEKKRIILIQEREKYLGLSEKLRNELELEIIKARDLITKTNISIGIEEVNYIAQNIEIDNNVDIKYKTIMGVEIPSIVYNERKAEMNYGIYDTPITLDEGIIALNKVKKLLVELAGIENTVERLDINISKVQKRSNALSDVIIPNYQIIEKQISDSLSEREREEFSRLKQLKKTTK